LGSSRSIIPLTNHTFPPPPPHHHHHQAHSLERQKRLTIGDVEGRSEVEIEIRAPQDQVVQQNAMQKKKH